MENIEQPTLLCAPLDAATSGNVRLCCADNSLQSPSTKQSERTLNLRDVVTQIERRESIYRSHLDEANTNIDKLNKALAGRDQYIKEVLGPRIRELKGQVSAKEDESAGLQAQLGEKDRAFADLICRIRPIVVSERYDRNVRASHW